MKCCEFKKNSQQNLTCYPGSLVVPDRFFGFWPSGIARCDCIVLGLSMVPLIESGKGMKKKKMKKRTRPAVCCPNPCFAMRYSKHYSNISRLTGISDTRVCKSWLTIHAYLWAQLKLYPQRSAATSCLGRVWLRGTRPSAPPWNS